MAHIFVSSASGSTVLIQNIDLDNDVSSIEKALLSKIPIETNNHPLQFAGKVLKKNTSLTSYGLQDGSTVQVLDRLRGGAQLGKLVKGRSQIKEEKVKDANDSNTKKYSNIIQADDSSLVASKMARLELKRQVDIEESNSRTNGLKIQNQWRKIMRLAKVKSLKQDIEILSQNHERNIDRKDAIIQMLDRDLEEAEDQYQIAFRAHLCCMDELIDIHDSRLLALEQAFRNELEAMKEEFDIEQNIISMQHEKDKAELNDIIAAVDSKETDWEAEARAGQDQLREEVRNRNLEEINILHITLDTQIEELEQLFESAHVSYLQSTDQRTSDFKSLSIKDKEMTLEIELKKKNIEKLQRNLGQVKLKLALFEKESEEKNLSLISKKRGVQAHTGRLRDQMNKDREAQRKKLLRLSQDAGAAKSKLQDQLDLAERILRLAEIARKAETDIEKVIPYYPTPQTDAIVIEEGVSFSPRRKNTPPPTDVLGPKRAQSAGQSNACTVAGVYVDKSMCLDNFNKKLNRALLDRVAIEKEEDRLQEENEQLRALVKHYVQSVSVGPNAVTGANPLLVVNGKVNLVTKPPPQEVRAPAIDALHMVHTGRVDTIRPL